MDRNPDGTFATGNQCAARRQPYAPEELSLEHFIDLLTPDRLAMLAEVMAKLEAEHLLDPPVDLNDFPPVDPWADLAPPDPFSW